MKQLACVTPVCVLFLLCSFITSLAQDTQPISRSEPIVIEVELGTLEHTEQYINELDSDDLDLDELDLDDIELDELDEIVGDDILDDEDGASDADLDLGSVSIFGSASLITLLGDSRAITIINTSQFGTSQSLGEILERLPGVDVHHNGGTGQLTTLQVRGARSEQVLVLVDGTPLGQGSTDLTQIPLGAIASVELLRGPQAIRFGMGALGGVLNIITQAPTSNRNVEKETPLFDASWFKFTAGTNSLSQVELLSHQRDTSVYLSHLQARNNFDFIRVGGNNATRDNNETLQDDMWVSWRTEENIYRAGLTSLQRGVPGSAEQPTTLAQLARRRVWWNLKNDELSADLSITQSHFTDPEPYLGGAALDYMDTLVQTQVAWGSLANQRGNWGIKPQFAYIDSSKWGEHTRGGLDAHYYYEHHTGNWLWQLDSGFVVSSDVGIDPAIRIGASHQLNPLSQLYIASSYAVRHPSFNELYYIDTGGVRGNPNLNPERVIGAELGWHYDHRLNASAAAFYNSYEDSIVWIPVSAYLVEARNTGRAEVSGLECSLLLPLGNGWNWQGAYTWLPLAQFASGTPLTGRSEHHANASIGYSTIDWTGMLLCDYTGSIPADQFGNLVIKPRTLWKAELMHEFTKSQVSLSITNLFSKNARDSWNYPLSKREFMLSYRVDF